MICKICDKQLNDIRSLSIHLNYHKLSIVDYFIKYENFEIPKCVICGEESKRINGLNFNRTCGSKDCISKLNKSRTHSDETKKVISKKRRIYLKNNPDKHVWKRSKKFTSNPCELFKEKLKDNSISFVSEYSPLEDRFYSIDIAFPLDKIGVEINGNQHYNNNKTLKKYYKERKIKIEEQGWKLYDIYYLKVYDDDFVKGFIDYLKGNYELKNVDFSFDIKQKNKCVDCETEIQRNSVRCKKCASIEMGKQRRVVDRPDMQQLEYDIQQLGYRGSGEKYNVSDNSIRKWLKNYKNKE